MKKILLVVAVIILAGVWFVAKSQKDGNGTEQNNSQTEQVDEATTRTYTNEQSGYKFDYPSGWEKLVGSDTLISEDSNLRLDIVNNSQLWSRMFQVEYIDSGQIMLLGKPTTYKVYSGREVETNKETVDRFAEMELNKDLTLVFQYNLNNEAEAKVVLQQIASTFIFTN